MQCDPSRFDLNGHLFTGILCCKYDNGNYQTQQQYLHDVGKGNREDYNPEGIIECDGAYNKQWFKRTNSVLL